MDPEREPAGLGQARVGRIRPRQVGVRRSPPGIVDRDDAEAQQLERDRHDARPRGRPAPIGGMWTVTRRVGRLVAGRPPARRRASRRMSPPAGSGVSRSTPAAVERGTARRAARGGRAPTARSDGRARRSRGRRPSASGPSGRRPSRGPRATPRGSASATWAARTRARPSASVAASVRSTWRVAAAASREVEVRVGETRDRDLVGLERDPLRERVGPRLEVDLRPGERHPAVADPDRLDPAEPVVAGERRDPAGDQRVERHGVRASGSARSAASPSRSSPAPSPSASATRALTAHRWPTGSAPARIHVAPPPGNA